MRLTNRRNNQKAFTMAQPGHIDGDGHQGGKFTGKHMLALMFSFFGVIIAVNVLMATLASRSWTGLVVKNSYVASQGYNAELAKADAQAKRGWTGKVAYKSGALEFRIHDKAGAPVLLKDAVVKVGRPAFEQEDRLLALTSLGNGTYTADTDLKPGPWFVRVTADHAVGPYRLDARISVRAPGTVR